MARHESGLLASCWYREHLFQKHTASRESIVKWNREEREGMSREIFEDTNSLHLGCSPLLQELLQLEGTGTGLHSASGWFLHDCPMLSYVSTGLRVRVWKVPPPHSSSSKYKGLVIEFYCCKGSYRSSYHSCSQAISSVRTPSEPQHFLDSYVVALKLVASIK